MFWISRQERSVAVFLCLAIGMGGCGRLQRADTSYPSHAPSDSAVATRFQEPETSNATLIESAVELSDKYAKLSEKATALQQLNRDLQQENSQLKAKIQSLEAELKQLDAQLSESNELVMDLNGELQMWKKDVLGFRSEMRAAATAQINALMKIMTAMGVEAEGDVQVSEENAGDQSELN